MIKKEKTGWVIREKVLNNKSRKGKYVYLKQRGKRGSYYKLQQGMSLQNDLETFMSFYKTGVKIKKKGIRKIVTHRKLINQARLKGRVIDQILGKGIWSTHLSDAFNMTPQQVNASYQELLRGAVLTKDKETLALLTQPSNIQKLKHRFEFKINILGQSGTPLVTLETMGTKDLEQVISEIKTFFKVGESITQQSPNKFRDIKVAGYNPRFMQKGIVHSAGIKIIMRKG